jgi:hypothetical protein
VIQKFTLENRSKESVTLYPKANSSLVVMWQVCSEEELKREEYNRESYSFEFHTCGKPFTLNPSQRVDVFLSLCPTIRLSPQATTWAFLLFFFFFFC